MTENQTKSFIEKLTDPDYPYFMYVCDEWEEKTVALKDDHPEIVEAAMKLAFYKAMLDSELAGPMLDDADQEYSIRKYKERIVKYTNEFRELVNEAL